MKFPLPDHPFRKVQLTPAQCNEYEHVSTSLLHETLGEYERFVALDNRTLSKKQWKAVKTRENLTVYKQTERASLLRSSPQPSSSIAQVATNMQEWKLPKLLAVGSIVGTLDDVMYGVAAPDVKSMLVRSSYVNDELVDGGVLYQMKSATEQDPFQFLGIKWLVKAHPSGLNAVVSPRDTVVIDATGVYTQPYNGDRIGYHVIHSVMLPECPELANTHSILRGYLSACYLFKQTPNGTVEVFMKTFVDPGGRLSESLATMSVANALIGCYKSVLCAQGKKLTWLIKRNAMERMKDHKRTKKGSDAAHGCELCHTPFRAYKTARGCQSCARSICSRCQIARKISYMQRGLQVKATAVVVCKDCVAQAAQLSAHHVAHDEFVGKKSHQQSLLTDAHAASDSDGDSWTLSSNASLNLNVNLDLGDFGELPGSIIESSTFESATPPECNSCQSCSPPFYSNNSIARTVSIDRDVALYNSGDLAVSSSVLSSHMESPPTTASAMPHHDDHSHRQQLWMQMNQLRLAAEQTYMITKQNASAMRFA